MLQEFVTEKRNRPENQSGFQSGASAQLFLVVVSAIRVKNSATVRFTATPEGEGMGIRMPKEPRPRLQLAIKA